MALTRAEISRRYRQRHPARHKESTRRTNEKRKLRILKQKEVDELSAIVMRNSDTHA